VKATSGLYLQPHSASQMGVASDALDTEPPFDPEAPPRGAFNSTSTNAATTLIDSLATEGGGRRRLREHEELGDGIIGPGVTVALPLVVVSLTNIIMLASDADRRGRGG